MNTKTRRTIAIILVILGGVLLYLAPEPMTLGGVILITLGVIIEAVGIYLEKKAERSES